MKVDILATKKAGKLLGKLDKPYLDDLAKQISDIDSKLNSSAGGVFGFDMLNGHRSLFVLNEERNPVLVWVGHHDDYGPISNMMTKDLDKAKDQLLSGGGKDLTLNSSKIPKDISLREFSDKYIKRSSEINSTPKANLNRPPVEGQNQNQDQGAKRKFDVEAQQADIILNNSSEKMVAYDVDNKTSYVYDVDSDVLVTVEPDGSRSVNYETAAEDFDDISDKHHVEFMGPESTRSHVNVAPNSSFSPPSASSVPPPSVAHARPAVGPVSFSPAVGGKPWSTSIKDGALSQRSNNAGFNMKEAMEEAVQNIDAARENILFVDVQDSIKSGEVKYRGSPEAMAKLNQLSAGELFQMKDKVLDTFKDPNAFAQVFGHDKSTPGVLVYNSQAGDSLFKGKDLSHIDSGIGKAFVFDHELGHLIGTNGIVSDITKGVDLDGHGRPLLNRPEGILKESVADAYAMARGIQRFGADKMGDIASVSRAVNVIGYENASDGALKYMTSEVMDKIAHDAKTMDFSKMSAMDTVKYASDVAHRHAPTHAERDAVKDAFYFLSNKSDKDFLEMAQISVETKDRFVSYTGMKASEAYIKDNLHRPEVAALHDQMVARAKEHGFGTDDFFERHGKPPIVHTPEVIVIPEPARLPDAPPPKQVIVPGMEGAPLPEPPVSPPKRSGTAPMGTPKHALPDDLPKAPDMPVDKMPMDKMPMDKIPVDQPPIRPQPNIEIAAVNPPPPDPVGFAPERTNSSTIDPLMSVDPDAPIVSTNSSHADTSTIKSGTAMDGRGNGAVASDLVDAAPKGMLGRAADAIGGMGKKGNMVIGGVAGGVAGGLRLLGGGSLEDAALDVAGGVVPGAETARVAMNGGDEEAITDMATIEAVSEGSSILGGAAAGALMGAWLGPIGAVAGGIGGGIAAGYAAEKVTTDMVDGEENDGWIARNLKDGYGYFFDDDEPETPVASQEEIDEYNEMQENLANAGVTNFVEEFEERPPNHVEISPEEQPDYIDPATIMSVEPEPELMSMAPEDSVFYTSEEPLMSVEPESSVESKFYVSENPPNHVEISPEEQPDYVSAVSSAGTPSA